MKFELVNWSANCDTYSVATHFESRENIAITGCCVLRMSIFNFILDIRSEVKELKWRTTRNKPPLRLHVTCLEWNISILWDSSESRILNLRMANRVYVGYSYLHTGNKYLSLCAICLPKLYYVFVGMKLKCRMLTFTIHNIIWVTFTSIPRDVAVHEQTFPIGNTDVWNLLLQVCGIKCLTVVMPQLVGQRVSMCSLSVIYWLLVHGIVSSTFTESL
jgi:hypothetical protein